MRPALRLGMGCHKERNWLWMMALWMKQVKEQVRLRALLR
jgi:hypothetical protein